MKRRRRHPRPSPDQARREAREALRFAAWTAALAVAPMVVFLGMWLPERRLAEGPEVRAEVVGRPDVRPFKGPPFTTKARVRFVSSAGRTVETTLRTTRTEIGRTVRLTYDPAAPERVRAVEGPSQAWRFPLIIGGSLLAVASLGAWQSLRLWMGRPPRSYLKSRVARPDDLPA